MDAWLLFARLVLGAMFLSAALYKLNHWDDHLVIIKEYQILPRKWAKAFARADLSLELLAAVLLVLGVFQAVAAWLVVLLLAAYTAAIGINLLRGRTEISCGCGGVAGQHPISYGLLARNVLLIGAGVLVALQDNGTLGSLQALWSGAAWADVYGLMFWLILFAAVFTTLIWTFGSDALTIRQHMRRLQQEKGV